MAGKILVIGSGYLGGRVARRLLREGYDVDATTRSHEKAQALDSLGIRPILTELTTAKGFGEFDQYDSIVLAPAPDQGNAASYENLFETGFERLLTYLHFHPPKKNLIYTSSVGVYEEKDGAWVKEEHPTPGTTIRTRSLLFAEEKVLSAPFHTLILRLGGIYGPDRNRIHSVLEGALPTMDLEGYVNMIFIEDAVEAVLFGIRNTDLKGIYNVVDTEPVKRKALWDWLSKKLEKPPAESNQPDSSQPGRGGNKRVSNKKWAQTGFQYSYPTFREGYDHLLSSYINPSDKL